MNLSVTGLFKVNSKASSFYDLDEFDFLVLIDGFDFIESSGKLPQSKLLCNVNPRLF